METGLQIPPVAWQSDETCSVLRWGQYVRQRTKDIRVGHVFEPQYALVDAEATVPRSAGVRTEKIFSGGDRGFFLRDEPGPNSGENIVNRMELFYNFGAPRHLRTFRHGIPIPYAAER